MGLDKKAEDQILNVLLEIKKELQDIRSILERQSVNAEVVIDKIRKNIQYGINDLQDTRKIDFERMYNSAKENLKTTNINSMF